MSKFLVFTANTTYNRQDVGPDYFDGPVEVEDSWAKIFIEQGRAEEVLPEVVEDDQSEADTGDETTVSTEVVADAEKVVSVESTNEETAEPREEGNQVSSGLDTQSASAAVTKTSKKK